eukprot:5042441-Prymnesium_polylepis.2
MAHGRTHRQAIACVCPAIQYGPIVNTPSETRTDGPQRASSLLLTATDHKEAAPILTPHGQLQAARLAVQ